MAPSPLYFALFGSKGSGKTAYLATLYSSSGDAADTSLAYHVSASEDPDDPTHSYLGRIGLAMKAGRWPDSNPFERLAELKLRFKMGDIDRELILPDVAGELTRREEQDQPELKKEILASYQDYPGVLLFAPADLTDPELATRFKWEVDALLNALRERIPEGRTKIARPIAVLLTKWDLIEPGPLVDASEARATAFFETIHPDQAAGLRTLCENFRIFPVSATGPLVAGRLPVPLRPTNLGEPIAWLVETAERVMLERAMAYFEQHETELFKRPSGDARRRTHYKIAIDRLNDVKKDVPKGLLADMVDARLGEVKMRGRRRWYRRGKIVGSIVVSLVVLIPCYFDFIAYRQVYGLLEASSPEVSPSEVVDRVRAVIDEPFLSYQVRRILPWWEGPRNAAELYRKDFESRSFEEISRSANLLDEEEEKDARTLAGKIAIYETDFPDSLRSTELIQFRRKAENVVLRSEERRQKSRIDADTKEYQIHPDDPGIADKLLKECETFLKELPGSGHTASVQALRAKIQAQLSITKRVKKFEELQSQLTKVVGFPLVCYQLCTGFLKDDPSHPMAGKVAVDRERFLAKADDQAWDEVIGHARRYPSLFTEHSEMCKSYMNNALYTAHQKEASEFKRLCDRGYDRATYEAIRTRDRDGNDPATLLDLRRRCTNYLEAPIPEKKMIAEIKAWAKWFDDWENGREFTVRVAWVRIDRDSAWHYHLWPSDPWVHTTIQVGKKTDSTGDRSIPLGREVLEIPDSRLGPFAWKWGDPEVVVTLAYQDASPPKFLTDFTESDLFQVRHLNHRIAFNGGKIAVSLECPEVVPPSLPLYKE